MILDVNSADQTLAALKIRGTTNSLGPKHSLDKFYTKPEVVELCLQNVDLKDYDTVIEPSAGSGAFSSVIPGCLAYDLAPEAAHIQQADWLLLDKTPFLNRKVLVIGNPPFGSNGSLALKFIVESAKFAQGVAFILPKGFKKTSVKNRIPRELFLDKEVDLPSKSFTLLGADYGVPCVFQLWSRREGQLREIVTPKRSSDYFKFVTPDAADFRVQRVGGRAGKASDNLEAAASTNYFLKNTSSYSVSELIDIFNSLNYTTINDTTGPRSLSKVELVETFEEKVSQ